VHGIGCVAISASGQRCKEVGHTQENVPGVSVTPTMFLHTCEACCDLAQGVSASRRALSGTRLRGGQTRTGGPSSRREVVTQPLQHR